MIKDVTFGQYLQTGSILHKADPRQKTLTMLLLIIFVFVAENFISLALICAVTLALMITSKVPLKMYFKNLKSILPIIILTSLLNMFYIETGTVLVDFWIITITTDGIIKAVFVSLRVMILILISSVFSYTTSPTSLTGAIESLLKPLSYIGLKGAVHTVAMTMTIALRFIPTLLEETGKIMNAQKARGTDFETGGLVKRVKALLPILIPLLISSIRRAYELAEAMECRCYSGAENRTKYRLLHYTKIDLVAFVGVAFVCAATIVLNIFF